MRLLPAIVAAAASLMVCVTPARAAVSVVRPTGQFPADVTNVQAAADRGGHVLLAATDVHGKPRAFNFGPAQAGGSGVDVSGSVAIVGERVPAGVTTIDGGDVPFLVVTDANTTISGIDFEGPFYSAITMYDFDSATVSGDRIEHVVGMVAAPGVSYGQGIESDAGGTLRITGNVIDDVDASFAIGIEQFGAHNDSVIAGNRVTSTNEIAIESGGAGDPSQIGHMQIEGNAVTPGPQRYPRGAAGTGIEINGAGSFTVAGNTATCANPNAVCILAFGQSEFFNFGPLVAPLIVGNRISAGADGVDGIGLIGQVSHAYVALNQVTGLGEAAFVMVGCGCGAKDDLFANSFLANDIQHFTSTLSDLYFDETTHDNLVVGGCRTVTDLGTNNHIACGARTPRTAAPLLARATGSRQITPPAPPSAASRP